MSLEPLIVEPQAGTDNHTHTIIFLHGRDSLADEFADELFESEASSQQDPEIQSIQTPAAATTNAHQPRSDDGSNESINRDLTLPALLPTVRWVFPRAQMLPCARFGGPMSQWFDMWSVEEPTERPELQSPGLTDSITRLLQLLRDEEARGTPCGRIFLCGISQGFATAIAAYLAQGQGGLAGLVGLCSWMPPLQGLNTTPQNGGIEKTPILLQHAKDDQVVAVDSGRKLLSALQARGFAPEWCEYEHGGHWLNEPQGVDDLVAFVRRCMAA